MVKHWVSGAAVRSHLALFLVVCLGFALPARDSHAQQMLPEGEWIAFARAAQTTVETPVGQSRRIEPAWIAAGVVLGTSGLAGLGTSVFYFLDGDMMSRPGMPPPPEMRMVQRDLSIAGMTLGAAVFVAGLVTTIFGVRGSAVTQMRTFQVSTVPLRDGASIVLSGVF